MAGEVIPINVHQASLDVRTSTSKAGKVKQRTAVTVTTQPIGVVLDEQIAGRVAEAVAKKIREQTEAITETVKASTAKARRVLEKAYAEGKPYAVRAYSGGRMGATPPRAGEARMFNHSGRLAGGIVARWQEGIKSFVINYAANRWNVSDFKSEAAMREAFQKWVDLVPILENRTVDKDVQAAAEDAFADTFIRGKMGEDHRGVMRRGQVVVKALQLLARAVAA